MAKRTPDNELLEWIRGICAQSRLGSPLITLSSGNAYAIAARSRANDELWLLLAVGRTSGTAVNADQSELAVGLAHTGDCIVGGSLRDLPRTPVSTVGTSPVGMCEVTDDEWLALIPSESLRGRRELRVTFMGHEGNVRQRRLRLPRLARPQIAP